MTGAGNNTMKRRKGLVIVNTGTGKGKTTAALGLLFRAWGHGMKVLMLQFLKSPDSECGQRNNRVLVAVWASGTRCRASGHGIENGVSTGSWMTTNRTKGLWSACSSEPASHLLPSPRPVS
jgi:ATP:corrinoid adenosyltransferase